jgi:aspartokinase
MTNNHLGSTTSVTKQIWRLLDRNPCVLRNMRSGLINVRALAAYLIREEKIKTTVDAAVSAIRRYNFDAYDTTFKGAHTVIREPTAISTRSPLAILSVVKDPDVQSILPRLYAGIQPDQGDVLRILQGNRSVKIVIDAHNLEFVKRLFSKKDILTIDENIGEICVHNMAENGRVTPGILAISANELAINTINVLDIMSGSSEILWFVEERDIQKAYNALYQLWKGNE